MHPDDYSCALCSCQDDETVEHLFLSCPFAVACWSSIGLQVNSAQGPFAALEDLRHQIALPFFYGNNYSNVMGYLDIKE
jgi:hypothetical protein